MKLLALAALWASAVAAQNAGNDTGPAVKVNQLGYLVSGPKRATLVSDASEPQDWKLLNKAGNVQASGKTTPRGLDTATNEEVHIVDFSKFKTTGEEYVLQVGEEKSYTFKIAKKLYDEVFQDALHWFYYQRSGIAIEADLAGEEYARPAGHVGVEPNQGDVDVPCQAESDALEFLGEPWTCNYTLDVTKGWYDAGDHGKYVVNGGISTAQLLQTHERTLHISQKFQLLREVAIPIPERNNRVPDILDEARWELEFMLKMQIPAGSPKQYINGGMVDVSGMVHHKIHDNEWTGIPLDPAADPKLRELHRPSTSATLNLAAVAAQAARLYQPYDLGFVKRTLAAAETAYNAAKKNPAIYAPDSDGNSGGGAYGDRDVSDEFYWAATELYLTTADEKYAKDIAANRYNSASAASAFSVPGGFSWGSVAAMARIDLATVPSRISNRKEIQQSVLEAADTVVALQKQNSNGFGVLMRNYVWGSNSNHLNSMQILGTAYDISKKAVYRDAALEAADYIFGRNGLGLSYVVGYGTKFPQFVHSRIFAPSYDENSPRAPDGSLAGGANQDAADPPADANLQGCEPQLCYIDDVESYSTNEIAINWNSALVWNAAWLAELS